ncbi:site-specific tyrosine recombinase XerD [Gemmata obscuriglobus]|uniref:tyrosine-type recombinase/integrase n=1 Tax=Gemmata obscuriglobus TaxID=114 RepID=UPI00016C4B40|nr:tyrosine-type recombinase/integrase [Gemmata obscuriglobus]QEG27848.1 site-specific tyrosine recombinase XerD [Gemmata obscuriglobus]VTS05222.1 catalytic phage domain protein : Site-specific recombinase XerD OS=Singulisphaera acidiphila (strain ATCC BAA-1392 / DSM 18658 / VKM B-2454 / MOB10) GN=Sinac_1635 PE=4 SV=1: Phage_integrase: Phage_integrase [Gemmata obscuriglobus UQM 2246]
MPRPKNPIPTPRCHKNRAVIDFYDGGKRRTVTLGPWGSPEAEREFARILAEVAATPDRSVGSNPTVNEVLLAFLRWADGYYRTPDGKPTHEVVELRLSARPVRELYGHTPAREFGPKALTAVRQQMIDAGLSRTLINRRADRIKRVFKWASSEELVPVAVYQALRTVTGLRRGRTEARESKPVGPVDGATVDATLPRLDAHLRAMIELQRFTGMRPGEACGFRLAQVDRTGEVWFYRPERHKTAHHGRGRVIPIGPKARAALLAFLLRDGPPPAGFVPPAPGDDTARLVLVDAYQEAGRERDAALLRDLARPIVFIAGCVVDPGAPLFSPAVAREERFKAARKNRKSKVPPSQQNRRKGAPERVPGAEFTVTAYGHAIRKAAAKAGVARWHPNQLRHTFGTEVRRVYGLEAAQVLLGHSRADVTQVYAERNESLAAEIAAKIG